MSIVTVHGPYTFGSKAVVDAGPVQATVNPANGLIWTFRYDGFSTRPAADFDWTFTGGTPATQADSKGPITVTYATPGAKTATLVVSGAGTGSDPSPPAGSYPITVTAVSGVAPLMAGPQQSGEEPPPDEYDPDAPAQEYDYEEEYDPADHTVTEVIGYVEDNPEELEDVIEAEQAGKARVTLLTHLESMREA
jgi:PKD repeat protein